MSVECESKTLGDDGSLCLDFTGDKALIHCIVQLVGFPRAQVLNSKVVL